MSSTDDDSAHNPLPPPTQTHSLWDKFPPWVSKNLRSKKSLKTFLKCWVAAWVSFVIMLPNKSLEQLGSTAFFAVLLSIMLPPNMPVQLFILAIGTLVVGLALGWAISCAAMAAALAARDQTVVRATLQKVAQSAAGLSNPDALFQAAIFNGEFLETSSTVVFGVFLGVGTFFLALMRAYAPKLALTSVFGTVAIDIFCSYGPLFPFSEYTLLNSLLTSVGCYVGIALIFVIFVFPETLNHSYLDASAGLLQTFKSMLAMQDEILRAGPRDVLAGTPLSAKINGARLGMMMPIQQLMAQRGMLSLEFSWGRWSAGDIQDMLPPMQTLMARLAAINNFIKLMAYPTGEHDDSEIAETNSVTSGRTVVGDSFLLRQFRERNHVAEAEHHVRLVDILPHLRESTAELRAAGIEVLDTLQRLIVSVNTKRWKRDHTEQDALVIELDKTINALRSAMDNFKTDKRFILLEPYRHLFEAADAGELKSVPLRSLHIAFVFTSNLVGTINGIITLAEYVVATAAKRPKARLWIPAGLSAIGKVLTAKKGSGGDVAGEDASPEEVSDKDNKIYKRDPDSRPPGNVVQKVFDVFHKIYKWTKTPEALFAFRYVFLTIALWLPQVVRSSAHFVYSERGVWALIMAQTTLNIYASDQIFNYVMRLGGTFIGAVIGMVCWYIGSGHGHGSPYGLGASMAVFLFPIIFLRLFAPPQHLVAIMMGGATFVLVVGFSWIDGNLNGVVQSIGLGWSVAWKRWVLVMIGAAASFIVMMVPPKSGRKSVRLRNAATISAISYLYSHLNSLWLASGQPFEESRRSHGDSEKDVTEQRHWPAELREMVIAIIQQLQDLRTRTAMSKWEGNIRGHWAFEDYNRLVDIQAEMLASLILMAGGLSSMDPEFRKAALPHTIVLNPHFISDVISTFFMVSQSLRTGEPLHEAQYKNLADRLHYHSSNSILEEDEDSPHGQGRKALRQSIMSYGYMFYATAAVAVLQMCQNLNELRTVVADLCGEVSLEGFERWRQEYDHAHAVA